MIPATRRIIYGSESADLHRGWDQDAIIIVRCVHVFFIF